MSQKRLVTSFKLTICQKCSDFEEGLQQIVKLGNFSF